MQLPKTSQRITCRIHCTQQDDPFPDQTILATVYESTAKLKGPYPGWDKDMHFVVSKDFFKSKPQNLVPCGNQFEVRVLPFAAAACTLSQRAGRSSCMRSSSDTIWPPHTLLPASSACDLQDIVDLAVTCVADHQGPDLPGGAVGLPAAPGRQQAQRVQGWRPLAHRLAAGLQRRRPLLRGGLHPHQVAGPGAVPKQCPGTDSISCS